MSEDTPTVAVLHGQEVLGIKKCTLCGETGDDGEKYGVRGIARITGNLCVDCAREVFDGAE